MLQFYLPNEPTDDPWIFTHGTNKPVKVGAGALDDAVRVFLQADVRFAIVATRVLELRLRLQCNANVVRHTIRQSWPDMQRVTNLHKRAQETCAKVAHARGTYVDCSVPFRLHFRCER